MRSDYGCRRAMRDSLLRHGYDSNYPMKRIRFEEFPELSMDNLTHGMPEMSKADKAALRTSLREHGYIGEPILLRKADDGRLFVVDGRNRYHACKELGIMPDFAVVDQSYSMEILEAEVWRRNGPRRHVSRADMAVWLHRRFGKSIAQAAEMSGVSHETVRRAMRNIENLKFTEQQIDEGLVDPNRSLTAEAKNAARLNRAQKSPGRNRTVYWDITLSPDHKRALAIYAALHRHKSEIKALRAILDKMMKAYDAGKDVELVVTDEVSS